LKTIGRLHDLVHADDQALQQGSSRTANDEALSRTPPHSAILHRRPKLQPSADGLNRLLKKDGDARHEQLFCLSTQSSGRISVDMGPSPGASDFFPQPVKARSKGFERFHVVVDRRCKEPGTPRFGASQVPRDEANARHKSTRRVALQPAQASSSVLSDAEARLATSSRNAMKAFETI